MGWDSELINDIDQIHYHREDIIFTGYVSEGELLQLYLSAIAVAYISY